MKNVLKISRLADVASGMMYLSQRGVIHRDLSLRNLLVDSKTLQVKVSDLGLGWNDSEEMHQILLPLRW
jgi:serine/threonine protein kinase